MISDAEYLQHDGVGLAELVRRGDVKGSELLEVAIRRAAALNPRLNAIVMPMYEQARERAAGVLTGAFAGVPFLLKDLKQDYAGVHTSWGSRALKHRGFVPREHAEITRRFLNAGMLIFGLTNVPELGSKGITEPLAWGATRNPWDLERTPGGSSGGSAAAVAAGIVPLAGASDGGGSIRIPASATGLFGLKPGRGRTPTGPGVSEAIHGAAMNHVLTRSVRDSAAMLDAIHGPETGGAFEVAPPSRSYLSELERDPVAHVPDGGARVSAPLRIAFSTRSPLGTPVDPEAVKATERTAALLEQLGYSVEQVEPGIDQAQLARDFLSVWYAQLAHMMRDIRNDHGATSRDFELDSLAMEAVASGRSAIDYADCYVRWTKYAYQLGAFFTRFDLYMTPTLAQQPPRIGQLAMPAAAVTLGKLLMPMGLTRMLALAPHKVEQLASANLAVTPFTQLVYPRCPCRCIRSPTACRSESSSWRATAAKGCCFHLQGSSSAHCPGVIADLPLTEAYSAAAVGALLGRARLGGVYGVVSMCSSSTSPLRTAAFHF
jgi:amidase